MTGSGNYSICTACGQRWHGKTVDHLGFALSACDSCGQWFVSDQCPPNYDDIYGTAEYEEVQVNPFTAVSDPKVFRRIATYSAFFNHVPHLDNGSLLDVGCGVGRFLIAARAAGWATTGIDVSKKAVEIGRVGAGLNITTETLADMRVKPQRYNAVTAFEVLEHLPEPSAVVRSAFDVLKTSGYFFCTVPNRLSPTVQSTVRQDWLPPVHLQFFTKSALEKLLVRSGGANVRTGYITAQDSLPFFSRFQKSLKHLLKGSRPDRLGLWGLAQRAG